MLGLMRDTAGLDPGALTSLPIFPLPNCVLLPGGLMPLHVFEPRYRDLTRDCLAGTQLMAVARLRPGYETAYYGRPPVYDRCGVGRIICSEELPDGRFALLVRRGRRARSPPPADHAVRPARRGDRPGRAAAPGSGPVVRVAGRVRRRGRRGADHGRRRAAGATRGV